jgi:hypothetical protein
MKENSERSVFRIGLTPALRDFPSKKPEGFFSCHISDEMRQEGFFKSLCFILKRMKPSDDQSEIGRDSGGGEPLRRRVPMNSGEGHHPSPVASLKTSDILLLPVI